ncbi:MAG: FAD-dependent oxidoreductase [Planctomycetes bacterium]|nr:FAD-dependent oxidoreductase [Planctomycetota bacterium]
MAGRRVLIVVGVAGGASCAARLRRLDEEAEIVMFERGPYISFANCGLPYHISGVIEERSKLLVQTPEGFGKRFNVDVRVNSEVLSIDRREQTVDVCGPDGKTYTEKYDNLVLSPGAEPIKPPFPGVDLPGVFTLRNVPDTDAILAYIDEKKPKKAVVVGGGYIGVEMAENLHHIGIEVAIIEMLPQVMAVFDPDMANFLHEHLHYQGIATWLGDGVAGFAQVDDGIEVKLQSGQTAVTDLVILSIGVRPDTKLARDADLAIGESRGIKVDALMRTSDPAIYAAGDAVEVTNLVTGKPAVIALAGPANRQGRIAADNICGRESVYSGTQGTSIVKVFDLVAACTGANERTLKAADIPYKKVHIHPASHAGYYPHAYQMTVKALFNPDNGKLLGVQIVGPDGVDKRIDIFAAALRCGVTVHELENYELAYAPPFGSAKDPVNMVGFVASNVLKGDLKVAYWEDYKFPLDGDEVVVDCRSQGEWDQGHVPGAVLIPIDQMRGRIGELPRDRKILVYCAVGIRAYMSCRILTQKGYDAWDLSGGYRTFRSVHPETATGIDPKDMFAELQEKFCTSPTQSARAAEK